MLQVVLEDLEPRCSLPLLESWVGGKRKVSRAGNSAVIYAPPVLRIGGLEACVKLQLQLLKSRAQSPQPYQRQYRRKRRETCTVMRSGSILGSCALCERLCDRTSDRT